MEYLKKTLSSLCSLMTLSGFEKRSKRELFAIAEELFDESYEDSFGNFVFVKHALDKDAPRLMIDAHFDRVGLMVTGIKDGGFVSVVNVGGLDTRILPSEEVVIYGNKEVYGIISSIPPHLKKGEDAHSAPKMSELYVDTGYSKEELEKIVSIGDPIIFKGELDELIGDRVCAPSLDNKACVCAALDAIRRTDASRLRYNVYVTVSAQEETGKCGAALCAYKIKPDIAIITDVNFGASEGDVGFDTIECGEGASVDVSALVDRRLTRSVIKLLTDKGLKHQIIAESSSTYTNNELISVTGTGVPTVLMSVPLRFMHTPVELVDLKDIRSLSDALLTVMEEL